MGATGSKSKNDSLVKKLKEGSKRERQTLQSKTNSRTTLVEEAINLSTDLKILDLSRSRSTSSTDVKTDKVPAEVQSGERPRERQSPTKHRHSKKVRPKAGISKVTQSTPFQIPSDSDHDVDEESEIIDSDEFDKYSFKNARPKQVKPKAGQQTRDGNKTSLGFSGLEENPCWSGSKAALAGSLNGSRETSPTSRGPRATVVRGNWTAELDPEPEPPEGEIILLGIPVNHRPLSREESETPAPDIIRPRYSEKIYLTDDLSDVEEILYLEKPQNDGSGTKAKPKTQWAMQNSNPDVTKPKDGAGPGALNVKQNATSLSSAIPIPMGVPSSYQYPHPTKIIEETDQETIVNLDSDVHLKEELCNLSERSLGYRSNLTSKATLISQHSTTLTDVESSCMAADNLVAETIERCDSFKWNHGVSSSYRSSWQDKYRVTKKKRKPRKNIRTSYMTGLYRNSVDSSSSSGSEHMSDEPSDDDERRRRHKYSKKGKVEYTVTNNYTDTAFRSQVKMSPNALVKQMKEEGIIPKLKEVHEARQQERMKHMADVESLRVTVNQMGRDPNSSLPSMDGNRHPMRLVPINAEDAGSCPDPSLIKRFGLCPSPQTRGSLERELSNVDDLPIPY